jgi:signal transduction histidine kinase
MRVVLRGPRSLQGRLALNLAALYLAATAMIAAVLVGRAYSTADQLSKEDLSRRARHLAFLLKVGPSGEALLELPDWLDSVYRSGAYLYAVRSPGGRIIGTSNTEVHDLAPRLPVPQSEPIPMRLRSFGVSRRDYYGLNVRLDSRAGPVWVMVARAADDDVLVRSLLREFVWNIAWLVPLVVAATLAMGVFAIRRGLRPLRQVSASAAAIEPGTISVRLPEAGLPTEVQPLVAAVNHALNRLEKGFAVQRQFTANAAHELRTPLAILSAGLESLSDTPEVALLRKDAARMNRLVEQLLRVARLDAVALDVSGTTDLGTVARDVVAYLAPLVMANGRSVAVQEPPDPVVVKGNRYAIEDALRNLVENAMTYAPPGTEIVVSIDPAKKIHVADRGPGVPVHARAFIFDRFWRGKGSPGHGAGLGLAIVLEIMKAHHGSVTIADDPGGGALFTLSFPVES